VFQARRKQEALDLEALEVALRASLHRAGAAALAILLSERGALPHPSPANVADRRGITTAEASASSRPWDRPSSSGAITSVRPAAAARVRATASWT